VSGRQTSGIWRLVARLFGGLGSAGTVAKPPNAVAKRTLAVAKPPAAPLVAARRLRERERERMQERVRRTREAYTHLRRAGSAPR
jgi:hypothetical protein